MQYNGRWLMVIAVLISLFGSSCHRDPVKAKLTPAVKAEYFAMRHLADSVYLAASIDTGAGHRMSFEFVQIPSDAMQMVDTILRQGTPLDITPADIQEMLAPEKVGLTGVAQFDAMEKAGMRMDGPVKTDDGGSSRKRGKIGTDSFTVKIDTLSNRDGLVALPRLKRMMMLFRPFKRYGNYVLIDMVRHRPDGQDQEEFRLVDLARK